MRSRSARVPWAVLLLVAASAGATTVVVDPASMDGWTLQVVDTGGTSGGFQAGPAVAPLGAGSLHEVIGPNGDDFVSLRNVDYQGVKLSEFTTLAYSTYVTTNVSCQATYIQLSLDLDGNGIFDPLGADDILFFEPCYQTGTYAMVSGPPVPDQCPATHPDCVATGFWQTWNALGGGWWSLKDGFGGPPLRTIPDYIATYGDASVINTNACLGGVRLTAGGGAGAWDNFDGNADAFTIGVNGTDTTYDFEPGPGSPPPCDPNSTTTTSTTTSTTSTTCPEFPFLIRTKGKIGNNAQIVGGIGANDPGGSLRLGKSAFGSDGETVAADRLKLGQGASVFDVLTNDLTGTGATIRGTVGTPTLPLTSPFCPIASPSCSGSDVTIPAGTESGPLAPGTYGRLTVGTAASLVLAPGTFQFCSVKTSKRVAVATTGPTTIEVRDTFRLANASFFGPTTGTPAPTIDVGGASFRIGATSVLQAHVSAPNAAISFGRSSELDGTFCASTSRSDKQVILACPSSPSGAFLESDPEAR